MKKTAEQVLLLILLFGSVSIANAGVSLEGGSKANTGNFSNELDNDVLSAETVLEHNERLLHGTTIGAGLNNSSNQQAKDLYVTAQRLYFNAMNTFRSGQKESARQMSYQSIRTLYRADKLQYQLAAN